MPSSSSTRRPVAAALPAQCAVLVLVMAAACACHVQAGAPFITGPIADVHVHLINTSMFQYSWTSDPANKPIARTWTLDEYEAAIAPAAIQPTKLVFCEVGAMEPFWAREAHYIQHLADTQPAGDDKPRISAIIAHVALQQGAAVVGPQLDALMKEVPLLRGVRQGDYPGETTPEFLLNKSLAEGISELGKRGLHYELMLGPDLWKNALELVKRVPETTFVLSHLASPDIVVGGPSSPGWAAWTESISALAAQPNTVMMVDGAPQEASHGTYGNWTTAEVAPYVTQAIQTFGWDRCMYAGNWFWLNLFGTYEQWAAAYVDILSGMSPAPTKEQLSALFVGTATRVYKL